MNLYEIKVWVIGLGIPRVFRNQTEDKLMQVLKAFNMGLAMQLIDPDDPYTVVCFARGKVTHIEYTQTGGTE